MRVGCRKMNFWRRVTICDPFFRAASRNSLKRQTHGPGPKRRREASACGIPRSLLHLQDEQRFLSAVTFYALQGELERTRRRTSTDLARSETG
jgi:hypothetical protein